MSDLIDRQAAIRAIEEEWDGCCSEYPATQIIYDTTEAIERLPTIQPEPHWIPVTEEPMDDLISRQAAIDALDKCHCGGKDENGRPWIYKENAVEAIEMVEPSPSAEPKRGRWILDRSGAYCCSKCMEPCAGYVMMKPRDKFCKMCGSRNEVTE